MNLTIHGIQCKYDGKCTDSRSNKCFECDNNTHEAKGTRGSYFKNHQTISKQQVYSKVIKFMKDNRITCEETIHQCDWVIENAYMFISDLFDIIKDELDIENM